MTAGDAAAVERPVILVVPGASAGAIVGEFQSRYARDYAVEEAGSAADALQRLTQLAGGAVPVTSVSREMQGRDVVIVGGGNSAGQAAVHLSRFARSVTVAIRRESLADTMSAYLIREIEANPRVTVRPQCTVVDGDGEGHLQWVVLRDEPTGQEERTDVGGLFLLLGAELHCSWLPTEVELDDHGFVLTGRDVPKSHWRDGRPPASLETTLPESSRRATCAPAR